MKPIDFLGTRFFELMLVQPRETFYTTVLVLAKSIVTLDMKDKKKKNQDFSMNVTHLKTLDYIMKNTHEDILKPLATVEAIVASVDRTRWGLEYEGMNNRGEHIDINDERAKVLDLYQRLKEALDPMVECVVDIVQEYSSDYRFNQGGSGSPSWLDSDAMGQKNE